MGGVSGVGSWELGTDASLSMSGPPYRKRAGIASHRLHDVVNLLADRGCLRWVGGERQCEHTQDCHRGHRSRPAWECHRSERAATLSSGASSAPAGMLTGSLVLDSLLAYQNIDMHPEVLMSCALQ